jgi:hypothetical protein
LRGLSSIRRTLTAPTETSAAAAISTAAHHTLIGLQPALGLTAAQQAVLDAHYAAYLGDIPDGVAKTNGIVLGEQAAAAVLALRVNDGRERESAARRSRSSTSWRRRLGSRLDDRSWSAVPGIRPLALESGSQFRPMARIR